MYTIRIAKCVKKFIDKQDKIQRLRLYNAIKQLPNGSDIKKLQNRVDNYRLRVGNYRIIYNIIKNELIINIIDVDNRGDIYKRI